MFAILLLLFIVVPIIEIGLFIQVGGLIGVWPTIMIVLLTAILGASLVRSQGIMTLMSVQSRLQKGELPAQQIVEGMLLAVAGVLLLTPGFMTDAFGMWLLLPIPRAFTAKQIMQRVKVNPVGGSGFHFHGQTGFGDNPFQSSQDNHHGDGNVFEGEYTQEVDKDKRLDKE